MSKLAIVVLGAVFAASAVHAGDDWNRGGRGKPKWEQRDFAVIRSVTPQYEQINQPRQECRSEWITEEVNRPNSPNYAGTIIGGVAGGVIGHQVGKGRGRDVATVAGTIIGAMVGNHVADPYRGGTVRSDTVSREVQRCRQVDEYSQRVRDYRVDYEYRSQIYSTTVERYPGKPGARIPVRLMVELDD